MKRGRMIELKELSQNDIGRTVNCLKPGKKKPEEGIIESYDEDYICVIFPLKKTDEIYSELLKQNLLEAYQADKRGVWIHHEELEFS